MLTERIGVMQRRETWLSELTFIQWRIASGNVQGLLSPSLAIPFYFSTSVTCPTKQAYCTGQVGRKVVYKQGSNSLLGTPHFMVKLFGDVWASGLQGKFRGIEFGHLYPLHLEQSIQALWFSFPSVGLGKGQRFDESSTIRYRPLSPILRPTIAFRLTLLAMVALRDL